MFYEENNEKDKITFVDSHACLYTVIRKEYDERANQRTSERTKWEKLVHIQDASQDWQLLKDMQQSMACQNINFFIYQKYVFFILKKNKNINILLYICFRIHIDDRSGKKLSNDLDHSLIQKLFATSILLMTIFYPKRNCFFMMDQSLHQTNRKDVCHRLQSHIRIRLFSDIYIILFLTYREVL